MSKKSFTESPLMNILTPNPDTETETPAKGEQTEQAEAAAQETPNRVTRLGSEYKATADFFEPRSRRVQLLMRPSIYSGIQHIAKRNRQSTNNLIETVLADFIEQIKMLDEQKKKKG